MKTIYLDLFSGISGDMFIGALLDLGVDFRALEAELDKLSLDEAHVHSRRGTKSGISGVKFDVHLGHHEARGAEGKPGHEHSGHSHEAGSHSHDHSHAHEHKHDHEHDHEHDASGHGHGHDHPAGSGVGGRHTHEHSHQHAHAPEHELSHDHSHKHEHEHGPGHSHEIDQGHGHEHEAHGHPHSRNFKAIRQLIETSSLSAWVKEKAIAVFERVARAEGQIHGLPPEQVHFHEVGAVDSIMDIVGACVCLDLLGRPRVLASRVVEGSGWIRCAHGNFPIPAPATLAILAQRGVALTQCEEPHELVTPTGAAILVEFAEGFGPMHDLAPNRIGIGLGTRDNLTRPNVLRAILTDEPSAAGPGWEADTVCVLETNLDDTTPELLGGFLERAMDQGALDVFFAPIQMKKNRPAVLLSVICAVSAADRFTELVLRETTAFGVRRSTLERRKLAREFKQAQTPLGEVTIKLGRLGTEILQAAPEYESCRALAARSGLPVRQVFDAARRAAAEFLTAQR